MGDKVESIPLHRSASNETRWMRPIAAQSGKGCVSRGKAKRKESVLSRHIQPSNTRPAVQLPENGVVAYRTESHCMRGTDKPLYTKEVLRPYYGRHVHVCQMLTTS